MISQNQKESMSRELSIIYHSRDLHIKEIGQWLHDEKQIDLDRSTVSKMRNHVELKARKTGI